MEIDLEKYEGRMPGEWAIDWHVARLDIHAGGPLVATVRRHTASDADDDVAIANARLIADAPALLDEVVRLRADLAEAVQTLEAIEIAARMRFSPADILDENSPIREGMRAVLAKHGGGK